MSNIKYLDMTVDVWDRRAKRYSGLGAVMNTAYPRMEMLAETHRQKKYIMGLPLPWTKFEQVYDENGALVDMMRTEQSDMTVLDAGCGVGRLLHVLHGLAGRADGLDWSGEMLKIANANYPDFLFLKADLRNRGAVEKASYDCVFAWNVLSHITDHAGWEQAVKNLKYWASRFVVIADYLDRGPESPSTRLYGAAALKRIMRWEPLYEGEYTMKIGSADFHTMEVLVFAPASERRQGKIEVAVEEEVLLDLGSDAEIEVVDVPVVVEA